MGFFRTNSKYFEMIENEILELINNEDETKDEKHR